MIRAMDSASPIPADTLLGRISALRRHFEISLYLLLLTGVLTLVSTGKLDLVTIFLLPAALLFKGYRWWRGKGPEISNRVATWITIAYFIFFPFDLWIVSRMLARGAQNPGLYGALLATIHLMLFAIIVRLYSATTTRDYLFLTLMAFTSMLASAILTVDTVFLVFFFIFLGLAVSTFVSLEMWRSAKDAVTPPLEKGTGAAQRLHNALGITSVGIALGSVLAGALIFLVLPRFSGGYMSGFNLQPTLISGFSDDVELGEIGVIKRSTAVVMRVSVDGGLNAAHGVHWRGIALTDFDGRRWFNQPHEPTTLTAGSNGWFHIRNDQPELQMTGKQIHYSVLLEPIASSALFFANDAESVRGQFYAGSGASPYGRRRAYLLEDATDSVSNPYHNFARMQYEARSLLPTPPPAKLRLAGSSYSDSIRKTYLQLPPLDPRIPALAKQITARATSPYDKARAIEAYLQMHYGYTLDLTGSPQPDPLTYFLFQKRAGHCEYFATAMTVMVRSLGIPARYVNGFQTGEYNDVGGDFVVRASDAHSWVEVYFPTFGWLTFDPTPAVDDASAGLLDRIGHYWDWFELQWSEWVINYDIVHQFTLAQDVQRVSHSWTERLQVTFADARRYATRQLELWQSRAAQTPSAMPVAFAILAALAASLLALQPKVRQRLLTLWHLRVTRTTGMTPHLATIQYNEMLRLLEQRGYRKAPEQTAWEFATSLPDGNLAAPVQELTSMYQAARFGAQATDPRHASSILQRIQSFLHSR